MGFPSDKALEDLWKRLDEACNEGERSGISADLVAMTCYEAVASWHSDHAQPVKVSQMLETIASHAAAGDYHQSNTFQDGSDSPSPEDHQTRR